MIIRGCIFILKKTNSFQLINYKHTTIFYCNIFKLNIIDLKNDVDTIGFYALILFFFLLDLVLSTNFDLGFVLTWVLTLFGPWHTFGFSVRTLT